MTEIGDDRRGLLYRRRLLQRRLARIAKCETFRAAAAPIRCAGVRFSRLPPVAVSRAMGDLRFLPGKGERIDWSQVKESTCLSWRETSSRGGMFRAALEACAANHDPVAVIWHPSVSGMRIRAGDLKDHAQSILDLGSEIWICHADGGSWLIEYAAGDQEICYGRALIP
jgi:hypothetical protein